MKIKWVKSGDRQYDGVADGTVVARVVNTSATGTDYYPWDWYLIEPRGSRKSSGVSDTLRNAKETISYALSE